jgi:hypothetical protein
MCVYILWMLFVVDGTPGTGEKASLNSFLLKLAFSPGRSFPTSYFHASANCARGHSSGGAYRYRRYMLLMGARDLLIGPYLRTAGPHSQAYLTQLLSDDSIGG